MPGRCHEIAVVAGFARELAAAETHGDGHDAGLPGGIADGRKQVRDDALAGGGRSEGGYYFGSAQTSHQLRLRDVGAGTPGLAAPAGVCIIGTRD